MKELEISFHDPDLDTFVLRWMREGLTDAELREWRNILLYNRKFREDFCDFVKCFRESSATRPRGGAT